MTDQKPLELAHANNINACYENISNDTLRLSPNIKFKHLGDSWDFIQFICTWQRENNNVSIILNNQINIDRLNEHDEILLIAFYIAEKIFFQHNDIRKVLLPKFIDVVKNMNSPTLSQYLENTRAREIKFMCLGGAKNEFLRLFYNNDETFKPKRDIEDLIGNIINSPNSPIRTKHFTNNLDAIKEIIYEAFNNADKHGSRDIKQNRIPKNIRALSLNFTSFSTKDKDAFIENKKYYRNFLKDVKDVLVISIFDSGEGIIKKYIETTSSTKEINMSFNERKKILQEVFLPGVTSSQTPNSGMGLTYIKSRIKELKGLLSIKTSSLELFFSPTEKEVYQDHIIESHSRVGTLITVLIPIGFHGKNNVL